MGVHRSGGRSSQDRGCAGASGSDSGSGTSNSYVSNSSSRSLGKSRGALSISSSRRTVVRPGAGALEGRPERVLADARAAQEVLLDRGVVVVHHGVELVPQSLGARVRAHRAQGDDDRPRQARGSSRPSTRRWSCRSSSGMPVISNGRRSFSARAEGRSPVRAAKGGTADASRHRAEPVAGPGGCALRREVVMRGLLGTRGVRCGSGGGHHEVVVEMRESASSSPG